MKITILTRSMVIGALMALPNFAQTVNEHYAFKTVAGSPPGGRSVNGAGASAQFNGINSVTMDRAGNLYTAEYLASSIRKISPQGEVTTLAGISTADGSVDGKGNAARFRKPFGVTMDTNDRIIVADTFNHSIRRITLDGEVTTLAGNASDPRTVDGIGAAARFNAPTGVAVDGIGNIYVAEPGSHLIRKLTPEGKVTTLAGLGGVSGSANGTGTAARFFSPYGIAVTREGVVYVADMENHAIRKISTGGAVTTFAGLASMSGSRDGAGSEARFFNPYGVAVDESGNVYVGDRDNHAVRKITPDGKVTTLGGKPGLSGSVDGRGSKARFNKPCGLVIAKNGTLFVADLLNNTVRTGFPFSLMLPSASGETYSFGLGILDQERVVIETSADLINWIPLPAAPLSSESRFGDQGGFSTSGNKFYRARID